jgi:hypothetical protein
MGTADENPDTSIQEAGEVMATYIDEALIEYALKQSTVTAITNRIYHIQAPQDAARPYAVLNQVAPSDLSEEFGHNDIGQPLFQWTCVSRQGSSTPAEAFTLAHALLAIFRDLSGTVEGIKIRYMFSRGVRTISGVGKSDDVTCITETDVVYEGP